MRLQSSMCPREGALLSVLVLAVACSSVEPSADPMSADETVAPEFAAPPEVAAPRELTRDEGLSLYAEQFTFDGRELGARATLSDEERNAVADLLYARGIDVADVVFEGANLWIGDVFVDARQLLGDLRAAQVVEKGQVAAELVTAIVGTHNVPGTAVPTSVQAIPTIYARQENGQFTFNRPEVSGFTTFVVVPDDFPAGVSRAFTAAIQAIGNAGAGDCLGTSYLSLINRTNFAALVARSTFDTPFRAMVVKYESDPCAHAPGRTVFGCSQFPRIQNVPLSPPSPFPGGGGGGSQVRSQYGGYIALNSDFIVDTDPAFATTIITHELMHTLGVAHPQEDPFDPVFGTSLVKIVVPGTDAPEAGTATIMALVGAGNFSNTLSADDNHVIRTLYNSGVAPGCGYQTVLIPISPTP